MSVLVYKMNSLRIVLVAGLWSLSRITDMNDSERNMILGHTECLLQISEHSLMRICAAPYGAESEVGSAKKNVLYSCGAVLNPIISNRIGERAAEITRHNYNDRRIKASKQG